MCCEFIKYNHLGLFLLPLLVWTDKFIGIILNVQSTSVSIILCRELQHLNLHMVLFMGQAFDPEVSF